MRVAIHNAIGEVSAFFALNCSRMPRISAWASELGTTKMTEVIRSPVVYTSEEPLQLFVDIFRYSTSRATFCIDLLGKLTDSQEAKSKKNSHVFFWPPLYDREQSTRSWNERDKLT